MTSIISNMNIKHNFEHGININVEFGRRSYLRSIEGDYIK
jgi:hypothetical protein